MKKRKKKKKKVIIITSIILIIILLICAILITPKFFKEKEQEVTKVVDTIDKYSYTLDDRDTKLMKDTYEELKQILNNDPIDYTEYAKTLSKLFIIDLFTLNNKTSKYDVGGYEYVYPDAQENYKLNVEDTLYKTIKTDSDKRDKLPVIKSVEVLDLKEDVYKIADIEYPSYIMNLNFTYEEDLKYDTSAKITAIKKDDYIYIVEYKQGDK